MANYLFLQGPVGPFFRQLANELRAEGHVARRINLCGADKWFWSDRYSDDYKGTLEDWPNYFADYCEQHGITHIMAYGDCRPFHQLAIQEAKARGLNVYVFEEGYVRPKWITMEQGGVNGYSPMPRDPEFYAAREKPKPGYDADAVEAGQSFRWNMVFAAGYVLGCVLYMRRFPHYRRHRRHSLFKETVFSAWRLATMRLKHHLGVRKQRRLANADFDYYLVLLQLCGDSQIVQHSHYTGMAEFLVEVMQSFATHAPDDAHLMVKMHPLDPGISGCRRVTQSIAMDLNIVARVHFLDGGHLPSMVRDSSGAVTVNSTAGLSALHHGVPLKVMGKAPYNMKGLTFQGELDDFWQEAKPPREGLYANYRHYLLTHNQVNGSYYTAKGRKRAIPIILERLANGS